MRTERPPTATAVFFSPFSSIPFLLVRPKLLLFAITPIVINIAIFALAVLTLYNFVAIPVAEYLEQRVWGIGGMVAFAAKVWLTLILILLSGLLTFLLISPITSPFNDIISLRIERELLPPDLAAPDQPLAKSIMHAIRDALARLMFYLPILLFTLMVGLVPFIGPPIAALIGFLNASIFLSLDAYSYSLDRREMNFKAKMAFLRSHRDIWLPLGAGLAMFLTIPCSIVFLPILGCVAATRHYCQLVLRNRTAITDA